MLLAGQIAANDALKRDLEGIINGLQEYLESVKGQARQTSDECKSLRKDKEALLQRLEELEGEKSQLEIVAMDAENLRKVRFKNSCISKCQGIKNSEDSFLSRIFPQTLDRAMQLKTSFSFKPLPV